MGMDDFVNERQVFLQKFLEAEPSANQEGEKQWSFGENFSNIHDVTLKDIDTAIINEFNGKAAVYINGNVVPVVVGGSERWAIAKRTYLVDENQKLILPQISIKIGDTEYDTKRFVPTAKEGTTDLKLYTIIKSGEQTGNEAEVTQKDLYVSPPTPVICNYNVTIWCNYMSHLREISSKILHHFSMNTVYINEFFFTTELSPTISIQDNFDDYGSSERLMKGTFSIKVIAYLVDEKSYKVEQKVLSSKQKIYFGETVLKADEVKWRSPYQLTHKKLN